MKEHDSQALAPTPDQRSTQEPDRSRDAQPAPSTSPGVESVDARSLLWLQRSAGNQRVAALIASRRGQIPPHPTASAVQRWDPPGTGIPPPGTGSETHAASPQLDAASVSALEGAGLALDDSDEAALAREFPTGIDLHHQPTVYLTALDATSARGVRIEGYRVTGTAPLAPGVEAWIFQVGKGRSILISSIGGRSVLQDVGSGTSLNPADPAVQRLTRAVGLVTAGPAAAPSIINLSHSDADHFNAVRSVLELPAFSRTAVQVATEQLRGAGAGKWGSVQLTVRPEQRVIEIDVSGATGATSRQEGVHFSRRVIDNFELIELRSVEAHRQLTDQTRRTYSRNRTSPVTVVTDLVTGARTLYTSDAEGRQFTEIVDALGEAAFRRLLGTEGRRLAAMEIPHHGGRQAGPDASGMIRMLRLAYESSDGSLRLFTQTSESFASGRSASIRFLDVAGVEVERVLEDSSGAGEAQVRRLRGSQMSQVTMDLEGVRQVVEIGRANESTLHETYRKLHEIRQLRENISALKEVVSAGTNVPQSLSSSVAQLDTELSDTESRLRTRADSVWQRMQQAAAGRQGMRASRDVSSITQELQTLAREVNEVNLSRTAAGVETHVNGFTVYARLHYNALRMLSALAADQVEELHRLRAEHRKLLQAARGILGHAEVAEHVRSAWAATRGHWTGRRIERMLKETAGRLVSRQMSVDFRVLLTESLIRQGQLNEIVAKASHGALASVRAPGGRIVTPVSTRVGAGILAAIEVIRIGLEMADQVHQAGEAAAESAARSAREGVVVANWWLRKGVTPTLALTKRSSWSGRYDVISDGMGGQISVRQAALTDQPPAETPEFDRVVVEDIDRSAVLRLVRAWVVALANLEDWHDANLGPLGPMFKKFENGWGVRLWSRDDQEYRFYHLPEIDSDLDKLHEALERSQADELDLDVLSAGSGAVRTVKNTAWFGIDRDMYVFNERGYLDELDIEGFAPRVLIVRGPEYVGLARREMTLVRAADLGTYQHLSRWWWRRETGQTSISKSGIHREFVVEPNTRALAWVRPDELESGVLTSIYEMTVRGRHPEVAASVPDR